MEIIRGRLSSQDFSNPAIRYNPDTNIVEYTPDGGMTWNPDPADDPRHSPKFAKPLKTGSDVRCNSAASMVEWISNFIEYETSVMQAGATVTTVANAALTLFDIIAPWAILIQALIELAGVIFGIGATALETAFTDETYELLICCFYCHIQEDGSVRVDDLAGIQAQVTTDLNTTAALVVNLILSNQGEMGVQNAGTLYDVAGDCSDCTCAWCYTFDFETTPGIFEIGVGAPGVYIPGTGFQGTGVPSGSFLRAEGGVITTITEMSITYEVSGVSDMTGGLRLRCDGATVYGALMDGNPGTHTFHVEGLNQECDHIWFGGDSDTHQIVMSLTLHGIGDNPFGDDNC